MSAINIKNRTHDFTHVIVAEKKSRMQNLTFKKPMIWLFDWEKGEGDELVFQMNNKKYVVDLKQLSRNNDRQRIFNFVLGINASVNLSAIAYWSEEMGYWRQAQKGFCIRLFFPNFPDNLEIGISIEKIQGGQKHDG